MRSKNKIVLLFLVLVFIGTGAMFYYQNVYMKQQEQANKVTVLIAKRNISNGSLFSAENVAGMKLDKSAVLDGYLTQADFANIQGKTANSEIMANEILTKSRVGEEKDGSQQFRISVIPDKNNVPQLTKGDTVRIMIQTVNGKVMELFHKKEIVQINFKKSANGKETGTIDNFEVLGSDKDMVNYIAAKSAGKIMVVKYYDSADVDTQNIQIFTAQGITPLSEQTENKITSYVVKEGDTLESIAQANSTTKEEIVALNPGVVTPKPGDTLQIQKR